MSRNVILFRGAGLVRSRCKCGVRAPQPRFRRSFPNTLAAIAVQMWRSGASRGSGGRSRAEFLLREAGRTNVRDLLFLLASERALRIRECHEMSSFLGGPA